MRRRRGRAASDRALLAGPRSLARALGVTTKLTGTSLLGNRIWIEDRGMAVDPPTIIAGPRVGVDYARRGCPATVPLSHTGDALPRPGTAGLTAAVAPAGGCTGLFQAAAARDVHAEPDRGLAQRFSDPVLVRHRTANDHQAFHHRGQ